MKKIYSLFKGASFVCKTLMFLVTIFLSSTSSFSQTTLIDPAGDGGFETGATIAANGWTAVNGATDGWYVGNTPVVATGTNCGFVSATAGAAWTYSQINLVTHVYKDFVVPAGQNKLTLNFKWKASGEGSATNDWDNMKVFVAPTTFTPTAAAVTGQTQLSGVGAVSNRYFLSSTAWNSETITFAGVPGTAYRLIFSWKSDGSDIANPPAAIDDVSLVSSAPANYTSIATGQWTSPTTWDLGSVPSFLDNVTIAGTHTVNIGSAAQAANNLKIENTGTLNFGLTPTSFSVAGNLTVDSGGIFNLFNGATGKTLTVAKDITNNGRINTFVGTANQLILNGSAVQTVSGSGVFGGTVAGVTASNEVGVIRQLLCQNTSTATPNIVWNVADIRFAAILNTTGARINLGSNKIYIGNFAAIATHTSPIGTGFIGGTISRFWAPTSTGSAITAGTDPTNSTSRYPFLSPSGMQRAAYITRSAGGTNTAGYLTMQYANAATTTTGLSLLDAAYTVTDRTDSSWKISVESGYSTTTATHTLTIVANGILNAASTNARVMNASAFVGTHQNGTLTPGGQRTGISTADLIASPFYLGLNASEVSNSSVATGDWNNATTWSKGTVPTCTEGVVISAGNTVTVNSAANVASNTTIANTGTLIVASGDLVVGCTNNNTALTNNGTLTVSGGTLTVNGNINNALATSVFNQSNGAIVIDGNSGTIATSVASGLAIFNSESTNINLTGGTMTFVDPHASTTSGSNLVVRMNNGTASAATLATSPNHTIVFGDGVSTTQAGVPADGFRINNWVATAFLSFGNVEVNGNTATGRLVTSAFQITASGNVTIKNNSTLSLTSALVVAGNLDVNTGGTFVNVGGVAAAIVSSNTGANLTFGPTTLAQTFTNNGTCANLAAAATANLTSLTVNNTNAAGLTLASPFRVSGALVLTNGLVNTTNTNLLSHGTTTTAGTLTMPAVIPANTFVNGPLQRTIATANTNSTYTLFPVGKGSAYAPASFAPTTTTAVEMKVETFAANAGTADATILNLSSTRRWEAPVVSGTVTDVNARLSDSGIATTSVLVNGAAAAGIYTGSFGNATYTAALDGTPNTIQSTTALALANYTGFLSFADPNNCSGTPTPGNTTATSAAVCPSVNFTLGLQTATTGTGVTYKWQSSPDGIAAYTDIASQTAATTVLSQTAATFYQCVVTCANGSTTATSAPIQVTMSATLNCFCAAAVGFGADTDIGNVTFGALNNGVATPVVSNPTAVKTYTSFTNLPATNIAQGETRSFSVSQVTSGTTFYAAYANVFIDYNGNGVFDLPAERALSAGPTASTTNTVSGNITIPLTAVTGNVLMRVVLLEDGSNSTPACSPLGVGNTYGEVEDYVLNITPCVVPTISTQPATSALCLANALNLSVTATGTGLTYQWKKDGTDITSATSATYAIAAVTSANAASYTVLVTGACGSILSDAAVITVTTVAATASQVDVLCFGASTGTATATPSGGTAPYGYTWSNGQTTATATGLAAGTYTCTVTDANGCTNSTVSVTIAQPITAFTATSSQVNVLCNGASTGTATATPSGGTAPYGYAWSNGGSTGTLTGLAAGTYTCTVTDANGCTNSTVSVQITAPAALTATSSQVNVLCNGASTGTATATPSGGTSPYGYAWSNGQTTATANGLAAGTYTCTITDANGCTNSTVSVTITAPAAVNNAVTQSAGILTATQAGATYQWFACPAGTAISGATSQSFTPTVAGDYKVEITVGTCPAVSSACVTVTVLGTNNFDSQAFRFYPNPVDNVLNISYSTDLDTVKISNIIGQEVSFNKINATNAKIDMSTLPAGAYIVEVKSNDDYKTFKVIKN